MKVQKASEAELSALMRAANRGDQTSYRQFLSLLLPFLRILTRWILSRAGMGTTDVEDVVQENLLAIHLRRHTWDETARILPWVYGITKHKSVDAIRRRGRRMEIPIDGFGEIIAAPVARENVPETDMARLLGRLAEGQRRIVAAISIDGWSIKDAAANFGMSEGAARVTLHRGLKALARIYRSES